MSKAEGGSKTDTAVKLVLIFFISLLSFSVGTYVGKQVSDSDSHRAALEIDYSHPAGDATDAATANGAKDADKGEEKTKEGGGDEASTKPITDQEVSNLADEFIKTEARKPASKDGATADAPAEGAAPADAPAEGTAATAPAANDGYTHRSKMKAQTNEEMQNSEKVAANTPATTADVSVTTAAKRVANDMAPATDAKKAAKPNTALPGVATSAIGKFTVQIASFATEAEAKDRAATLTEKGYNAFYVPAVVSGKTWYRVSVGLFSDQKSATNYRTELLATQIVSTAIVQKIVK
jgi:cell division septation protein DedD